MKVYLDTNVLIAASVEGHRHHVQSFDLVKAAMEGSVAGCIGTYGLAEFYSVLTRAPFNPRVHPAEAARFLDDNISAKDYRAVLRTSASAGVIGGAVFDALHLHSAEKAGCNRIYTFNVKDFRLLAPPGMAGKITAP